MVQKQAPNKQTSVKIFHSRKDIRKDKVKRLSYKIAQWRGQGGYITNQQKEPFQPKESVKESQCGKKRSGCRRREENSRDK